MLGDEIKLFLKVYLNSRSVDIKLLKDGEGFLVQFIVDSDVSDVRCVVVVQSVDVLHHAAAVRLYCCNTSFVTFVASFYYIKHKKKNIQMK